MNVPLDPTLPSRYLANQLTEAERIEYEALLSRSVESLAELEATARLKVGLKKLADEGELPALQQDAPRARRSYLLPLAASVAAIYVGVALWRSIGPPTIPLFSASAGSFLGRDGHTLPLVAATEIFRRRSGAADASIELSDSRGILEWHWAAPQGATPERYDVVLTTSDGKPPQVVGEIKGLRADENGVVRWYVDSAGLVTDSYKLKISEESSTAQPGKAETFSIRVRLGPKK
jgi:hypothetical protein